MVRKCCKNAENAKVIMSVAGWLEKERERLNTAQSNKATNTARYEEEEEATHNYRIGQFSKRLVECTKSL